MYNDKLVKILLIDTDLNIGLVNNYFIKTEINHTNDNDDDEDDAKEAAEIVLKTILGKEGVYKSRLTYQFLIENTTSKLKAKVHLVCYTLRPYEKNYIVKQLKSAYKILFKLKYLIDFTHINDLDLSKLSNEDESIIYYIKKNFNIIKSSIFPSVSSASLDVTKSMETPVYLYTSNLVRNQKRKHKSSSKSSSKSSKKSSSKSSKKSSSKSSSKKKKRKLKAKYIKYKTKYLELKKLLEN